MRQLFGWSEQNHFSPQSSVEFKIKYLAFVLWITLAVLSDFNIGIGTWSIWDCSSGIFMLKKRDPREPKLWLEAVGLFLSSEKVPLNVWKNVVQIVIRVTGKVGWRPGDCPYWTEAERGPRWVRGLRDLSHVFWLHLQPQTTVGKEQKQLFSQRFLVADLERVMFIQWIWSGHLQSAAGAGIRVVATGSPTP